MTKKKIMWNSLAFSMFAILIVTPTLILSSCSSSNDSSDKDKTKYTFSAKEPSKDDKKHAANDPMFTSDYIAKWFAIDNDYINKYDALKIDKKINAAEGTMDLNVSFDDQSNVMYNGASVTSVEINYKGFNTSLKPIYKYNVSWKGPSSSDKNKEANDTTFTSDYIAKNWLSIDPDYLDSYGEPSIKATPHKSTETINLSIKFADKVYYTDDTHNNEVLSQVDEECGGFNKNVPIPKYTFSWKNPSASDLTKKPSNSFFTDGYIAGNWINISHDYITKYGEPAISTTPDDLGGKLTVKATFDSKAEVIVDGGKALDASKTFTGFEKSKPIPPSQYDFVWKEPSLTDLAKMSNDPSFNGAYAKANWMSYKNNCVGSVTTEANVNVGKILVGVNFSKATIIDDSGKPTYYTQKWVAGFSTGPQPHPDDMTVSFNEPSKADYELEADDPKFTNDYILKNWVAVDQRYIDVAGEPAITKTATVTTGEIKIALTFKLPIVYNGSKGTSFSYTFTGLYIPPTRDDLFFSWNKKEIPNSDLQPIQAKALTTQGAAQEFLSIPSGSKMEYTDVKSFSIEPTGTVNNRVNANLAITFRYPYQKDTASGTAQKTWTTSLTLDPDPNPKTYVYFKPLDNQQKAILPSKITAGWVKNNFIEMKTSNGDIVDPNLYIDKININPNDEDGSAVVSVLFNQMTTRMPPLGSEHPEYYATPSLYFNTTIRELSNNGKPYYQATGYSTDSQYYSRHNFDFSHINPENYDEYIYSFMTPNLTDNHIHFTDIQESFNASQHGVISNDVHYQPRDISNYNNFPDWESYAATAGTAYNTKRYNGGWVGEVNTLKSLHGTKMGLSIGGATVGAAQFNKIMQSPKLRKQTIDSSIELITRFGFDDIDIDWEYPIGASNMNNFTKFLKELREALDANPDQDVQNTQISIACGASMTHVDESIDLPKTNAYVDYYNIMDYDMHGTWDVVSGDATMVYDDSAIIEALYTGKTQVVVNGVTLHLHPEYFTKGELTTMHGTFPGEKSLKPFSAYDSAFDFIDRGVPSNKIVLGISTYDRGYKVKEAAGYKYPVEEIPGYLMHISSSSMGADIGGTFASYGWITQNTNGSDWKQIYNPATESTYFWNEKTKAWWTGDTPQSVSKKIDLVKKFDLGGLLTWEVADEYYGGTMHDGISHEFATQMSAPKPSNEDQTITNNTIKNHLDHEGLIDFNKKNYYLD